MLKRFLRFVLLAPSIRYFFFFCCCEMPVLVQATVSKKKQEKDSNAVRQFCFAVQACQNQEMLDDLKFCHREIDARPHAAKALSGLFKKGFFRKLAESTLKELKAEIDEQTVDMGAKIDGRLRRITDLPSEIQLKCILAVLPNFPAAATAEQKSAAFKVIFGIDNKTPYPLEPQFRREGAIIKALRMSWILNLKPFQNERFQAGRLEELFGSDFEYFAVVAGKAVCCLTGETKSFPMKNSEGLDFEWCVSDFDAASSAYFCPDGDISLRVSAVGLFAVGRHAQPSQAISINWSDVCGRS